MTTAARLAGHPFVAACGRSLTHLVVRSLTSSSAPSADLAGRADSRFLNVGSLVPGGASGAT